ncbi:hypothetical protein [Nocardia sp. NPDC004722]
MRTDEEVGDFARQAFRTAGQVRMLVERMAALGFNVDGYTHADIGLLADSLHGMAMRAAMSTDNPDALLFELTGRQGRRLDSGD